jgi:outer membrane protein assembly factor BamB
MRSLIAAVVAVMALALPSVSLSAEQAGPWPQWRGPNRDGKSPETGLLKQWPHGGPPLAWTAKGIGTGYASVAVTGGRIYTAGEAGDSSYVFALEENGGKQIWKSRLSSKTGQVGRQASAGPRTTPTVDGDLVFAMGQFGDLVCLQAADGKEVWRKHLTNDFGGKIQAWGFSESPLVDGDRVIVTPGGQKGTLVALNKKTGETIWVTDEWTDDAQYASPIAVDHGGVRQYIQFTQKSLAGVNAADGKVLWKAPWPGRTAVIPTPIFHDGHVYVTSGYNVGCALFKINADGGKFTADRVYKTEDMINHHGGVILHKGKVYGYSDGKGWTSQDFKTGQVAWQEKKLGKGSIAFADGCFYLREEGGRNGGASNVALIEATPEGYKEKGRFTQPGRSGASAWPHPVIAGGKLYIRDQDVLLCYDVKAK